MAKRLYTVMKVGVLLMFLSAGIAVAQTPPDHVQTRQHTAITPLQVVERSYSSRSDILHKSERSWRLR